MGAYRNLMALRARRPEERGAYRNLMAYGTIPKDHGWPGEA